MGGLRELSVRIYISPTKLAANDLNRTRSRASLEKENISLPAGSLEAANIDLTINLDKAYKDLVLNKTIAHKKN